ncbi:PLP-dependent transferase [Amylocystis lapponica]|nr:PLP-dependent transferase [Amylocystis lapponica]
MTMHNSAHADGAPAPNGISQPRGDGPAMLNVLPDEFYTPFLSTAAHNRKPDSIRSLLPLEQRPGVISLLAGKPNAATFPITSLQFTARNPNAPDADDIKIELTDDELATGLQYSLTSGLPDLCEWVYALQEFSHGRKKGEGWRVSIGAGSQDLIYKAVTAIVNPGDPVFIEAPVYAGVIPIFLSLECDIIEVETDENGICSHSLRVVLENWPPSKPKPKMLYTVPYGCNPTGMTATLERRLEILALSREHGFLILEDDPYYYLYYGKAPRPPSYFALESEQPDVGRVVRFDSLSKVLSSGIRVGFVSAPSRIVDAMDMHSQVVNLQPSSLTQMLALRVLRTWGLAGFQTHTEQVAQFYRAKRDVFEDAMRRHLGGLAEWATPEAGMFVWFKLLLGDVGEGEEHDSESIIRTQALARGVLALPGTAFLPNGRTTAYVRVSFSLLPLDQVDEALRRLREVILDARAAAK